MDMPLSCHSHWAQTYAWTVARMKSASLLRHLIMVCKEALGILRIALAARESTLSQETLLTKAHRFVEDLEFTWIKVLCFPMSSSNASLYIR
jgi:hypothetical protein